MPTERVQPSARGTVALLVAALLVAPCAAAQDAATSFPQLSNLVKPGDTVVVTDAKGHKTKGTLGALTPSTLELRIRQPAPDGRVTLVGLPLFSEGDVREIRLERHDSVLNGALIGFAVGATPGILLIAGRSHGSDPIQHTDTALAITLVPGAMTAGIGALVDALIFERRTVYRPPGSQSARLQVSPLLIGSAAGVRMSIRL